MSQILIVVGGVMVLANGFFLLVICLHGYRVARANKAARAGRGAAPQGHADLDRPLRQVGTDGAFVEDYYWELALD